MANTFLNHMNNIVRYNAIQNSLLLLRSAGYNLDDLVYSQLIIERDKLKTLINSKYGEDECDASESDIY